MKIAPGWQLPFGERIRSHVPRIPRRLFRCPAGVFSGRHQPYRLRGIKVGGWIPPRSGEFRGAPPVVIRPWFTPFIVAFWCLTTGWLVIAKILPSLAPGNPPGYQALYTAGGKPIPVAWSVLWNDQPLGWAMSLARPTDGGGLSVESRMRLDRIPLDEVLPGWTRTLVRRMVEAATAGPESISSQSGPSSPEDSVVGGGSVVHPGPLGLEASGVLSINAKGGLEAFSSTVDLPGVGDRVFLDGTVEDGRVGITIRSKGLRYETSRHLPTTIMLGDELSPQAMIPGLEPGKRWTVPTYSPLRVGSSPLEVLHAHVVGEESLFWEDHLVRVLVVEYRDDPASHHRPRSRLWVDRSGRVLRQESQLFGSTLAFLRRSDEAAAALAGNLEEEAASP